MVILDSYGGDADVAGTTGGVPGVVGGAEDVALGMGTVESTAWAGGMILVVPVVATHPEVTLEVLAYLGLLEVQHRPSNDSICRE